MSVDLESLRVDVSHVLGGNQGPRAEPGSHGRPGLGAAARAWFVGVGSPAAGRLGRFSTQCSSRGVAPWRTPWCPGGGRGTCPHWPLAASPSRHAKAAGYPAACPVPASAAMASGSSVTWGRVVSRGSGSGFSGEGSCNGACKALWQGGEPRLQGPRALGAPVGWDLSCAPTQCGEPHVAPWLSVLGLVI